MQSMDCRAKYESMVCVAQSMDCANPCFAPNNTCRKFDSNGIILLLASQDICTRTDDEDCVKNDVTAAALDIISITGVMLSIFGLVFSLASLLLFE